MYRKLIFNEEKTNYAISIIYEKYRISDDFIVFNGQNIKLNTFKCSVKLANSDIDKDIGEIYAVNYNKEHNNIVIYINFFDDGFYKVKDIFEVYPVIMANKIQCSCCGNIYINYFNEYCKCIYNSKNIIVLEATLNSIYLVKNKDNFNYMLNKKQILEKFTSGIIGNIL